MSSKYGKESLRKFLYTTIAAGMLAYSPGKSDAAVVAWDAASSSMMERIVATEIFYRTTESTWMSVHVPTETSCNEDTCSYNMGRLTPGVTYLIKARWVTEDEVGPFCESISYTPGPHDDGGGSSTGGAGRTGGGTRDDSSSEEDSSDNLEKIVEEDNTKEEEDKVIENSDPYLTSNWEILEDKIWLSGYVSDEKHTPHVYVNGYLAATDEGFWEYDLDYSGGDKYILIKAVDYHGGETTEYFKITEEGPFIGSSEDSLDSSETANMKKFQTLEDHTDSSVEVYSESNKSGDSSVKDNNESGSGGGGGCFIGSLGKSSTTAPKNEIDK